MQPDNQQQWSPQAKTGLPTWATILLVLFALLATGFAVYFWQTSQATDIDTEQTVSSTTSRSEPNLDTTPAVRSSQSTSQSTTPVRQLITGQVRQEQAGSDVIVQCHTLTGAIDTLWVRYGNTLSPQNVSDSIQEDFTEGEEGIYTSYPVIIPAEKFEPGKLYSYQCVGSKADQTYRAGIASFSAPQ